MRASSRLPGGSHATLWGSARRAAEGIGQPTRPARGSGGGCRRRRSCGARRTWSTACCCCRPRVARSRLLGVESAARARGIVGDERAGGRCAVALGDSRRYRRRSRWWHWWARPPAAGALPAAVPAPCARLCAVRESGSPPGRPAAVGQAECGLQRCLWEAAPGSVRCSECRGGRARRCKRPRAPAAGGQRPGGPLEGPIPPGCCRLRRRAPVKGSRRPQPRSSSRGPGSRSGCVQDAGQSSSGARGC